MQWLNPTTTAAPTNTAAASRTARGSGSRRSEKIRKAVKDDIALVTRCATDTLYGTKGVEIGEDGLRFIEMASPYLDLWDVNIGDIAEWGEDAGPSRFYPIAHENDWIRHIKQATTKPVVGVGRYYDPEKDAAGRQGRHHRHHRRGPPLDRGPLVAPQDRRGAVSTTSAHASAATSASRVGKWAVPVHLHAECYSRREYRRGWHPEKFEPAKSEHDVLIVGAGPAGSNARAF